MIEVRTFAETPLEAARFINPVWEREYGKSDVVPRWDEEYLGWEFDQARPRDADLLLGAYHGQRLVGTLFATPQRIAVKDRPIDAARASWLTVDPEYRNRLVGTLLVSGLRKRLTASGRPFCLGLATGSKDSPGKRFWEQYSAAFPKVVSLLPSIGQWVRILRHGKVAEARGGWLDRLGIGVLSPLQAAPGRAPADPDIRPYQPSDLHECAGLVKAMSAGCDLEYVWDEDALAFQLQSQGVPKTLVLESQGRVEGLVNYHQLECRGRVPLLVGVIDLLAVRDARPSASRRLLRSAPCAMTGAGVDLAMALRLPPFVPRVFLAAGFLPMPRDKVIVCIRGHGEIPEGLTGTKVFMLIR